MSTKLVLVLFIGLIASAVVADPFSFQNAPTPVPTIPPKKFTNLAEALAASEATIVTLKNSLNLPSLTFGFSVRGKPILEKAWGYLDLENAVPATINSIYRLASVSKTFTSTVIGTLVDAGRIKYTDPLSHYLKPDVYPPKSWAGHPVNITIGQLLSHMAGEKTLELSDIQKFIPGINVTQMISTLAHEPLIFKPGTNFNYSNYGFQLLGAVIESVTGKTYQQVLGEFLKKQEMNSSVVEVADAVIRNKARYYMAANASSLKINVPTSLIDELITQEGYWGAGGIMSNIPDLLRYGQRIIDAWKGRSGAMLTKKTLTEIWTPRTSSLPENGHMPTGTAYGYGWVVQELTGNPQLKHRHIRWHNGGLMGVSTQLILYPEEEVVGVALANKGGAQNLMAAMIIATMENVFEFC